MKKNVVIIICLMTLVFAATVQAERIKDIVTIQGVRGNPLSGIGIVIGLAGTGDTTIPSKRILNNILRQSGQVFSPSDLGGGNIALVMVTAELGPFARVGSRIDINVSSIGDASTLQGGVLVATALKGLDDQVYAVTRPIGVSLGGWSVSGDKASISKNHQLVGRIPDGAIVEREEIADFVTYAAGNRFVAFNLQNSDFRTALEITEVINKIFADSAVAVDAGTVQVKIPDNIKRSEISMFIDRITQGHVTVDMPAVVVINERTGTIVVGENVGMSAAAISQGSLVIKVRETEFVSQPGTMFSDAGTTERVPQTIIDVEEKTGHLIPVARSVTVSEMARSLNAIGATPRDLIAIFNALKKAGALQAKLEIM